MKINKIKLNLFVVMVGITVSSLSAQGIPDSIKNKIDSLFILWNTPNSPGCAVGIVHHDSLIYAKGYGMANLEYGIPNSPESIYHMASVSKQFTAYSIVLLARAGKLKLDEDIRIYLPWFPDLKTKITIRHLLNHTSGIRDQWQLLAISGTRLDDVITQDHIVKILSKQEALNSPPGEKYNYSNSGYTLLAEIVKSVSGQSLRKFTDSIIFKPLGMHATHFHDDYTEIVKNRAYSYDRQDSTRFNNRILSYSNAGATSLFTNVNDMSKWVMNFYRHTIGDQKDIETLTQKGMLNSGKELTYALGIAVGTYNGWRQYSHSGGDAGFRTYLMVLPDLEMGFFIFSNLGDFNTRAKTNAVAELFVKDTMPAKDTIKKVMRDSSMAILKDTLAMQKYMGHYISEDGLPFSFDIKNRKLFYHIYDENNFLAKETQDTFSIFDSPEIKFIFAIKSRDTTVDVKTPDQIYRLQKYIKDTSHSDVALKKYTGSYYCSELNCTYDIRLKGHELYLTNSKYNDAKLTLIGKDHLTNENWWINHIKILRDTKDQIAGFEVNSGRIMHLKFVKKGPNR